MQTLKSNFTKMMQILSIKPFFLKIQQLIGKQKYVIQKYLLNLLLLIYGLIIILTTLFFKDPSRNQVDFLKFSTIFSYLGNFVFTLLATFLVYKNILVSLQNLLMFLAVGCLFEQVFFFMQYGYFFVFERQLIQHVPKTKLNYILMFTLFIYTQLRCILISDIPNNILFMFAQLINILFAIYSNYPLLTRVHEKNDEKFMKQELQLKQSNQSKQYQNKSQMLKNQNDETHINNQNNSDLYFLQLDNSHKYGSSIDKQNNQQVLKNQEFSQIHHINETSTYLNHCALKIQGQISDDKCSSSKLHHRYEALPKFNPQLLILLWKSLNTLSSGIMLFNSKKMLLFKSKSVKLLLNKNNQKQNYVKSLFLLPLSLSNTNQNSQTEFTIMKSLNKAQNNTTSLIQDKSNNESSKERLANSILEDSRKRIDKQKTQTARLQGQQEQYGSVIYNFYQSSKYGSIEDSKQNLKKIKRMATAEVMLKDKEISSNSSYEKKQKIFQANLMLNNKDSSINNINLSNIGFHNLNKKDNDKQKQTRLSSNLGSQVNLLQQKNNISHNLVEDDDKIHKSNIITNQQGNNKYQTKTSLQNDFFPKPNSSQNEKTQNFNTPCSFRIDKNLQLLDAKRVSQEKYNQQNQMILNFDDLKSKFEKCIIPDTIDKLFQTDDLIVEDIVDYLLHHSISQKQQKFNTDYQLQKETQSKDDDSNEQDDYEEEVENEQLTGSADELQQDHLIDEQVLASQQNSYIKKQSQDKLKQQDNLKNERKIKSNIENSTNQQNYENEEEDKLQGSQESNSQSSGQENDKALHLDYDQKIFENMEEQSQTQPKVLQSLKESKKLKKEQFIDNLTIKQKRRKTKKLTNSNKRDYFYYINSNQLHIQVKIKNESNAYYFLELKLQCLILNDSEERFVMIEISDITRLKKAVDDDSLKEYKNKMLSSISHELRTPLNCSIQLLDMLVQSEDISEVIKQAFISPALYSNQLLLNIINDILDLAQINYGTFKMQFQQFELPKICAECLNLISLQAMQKNIILELELDPQIPPKMNSDPSRIRQVLLNLLGNALKFTQKGMISIKASMIEDNLIQIDVKDTGCGIPKSNLNKIMGSFGRDYQSQYTSTQKGDISANSLNTAGAGLGLTIANNLAAGLGGNRKLFVHSVENEGSIFSFCIVNHSLNQIGCTFEEKSLFSKQIINWECFSQQSQQQINPPLLVTRKSDNLSIYSPHSSSQCQYQLKKKNDENISTAANIKFTDNTMTILQFNNDILNNSINHQANYFNLSNQISTYNGQSFNELNQERKDSKMFDNFIDCKSLRSNVGLNSNRDIKTPKNFRDSRTGSRDISIQDLGSKKYKKYQIQFTDQNFERSSSIKDQKLSQKYMQCENGNSLNILNIQGGNSQNQLIDSRTDNIDYSNCSIHLRRKSGNDLITNPSNLSIKNSKIPQDQFFFKPIKCRTNSVLVMPSQFSQDGQITGKTNSSNNSIAHVLSSNSNEKVTQNALLSYTKCHNNYFHRQLPGSQTSLNRYLEGEEDSCNINFINESPKKKTPNEFNFIKSHHKSVKLLYQNSSLLFVRPSSNNLVSDYNMKNKNDIIRTQDCLNEYEQNSPPNQLSQINESFNEVSESVCILPQNNQQQLILSTQLKDEEQNNLKQNTYLQLPGSQKNMGKREQKEEVSQNNKQATTSSKRLSLVFSHHLIPIKIEEQPKQEEKPKQINKSNNIQETKQTKSIQFQQYNSQRKCKCPNVLIVDDNEFNIYALEMRLKLYGFIADKATNGMKALEFVETKYREKSPKCSCHLYSIIFMDIDMPVKNGYETTEDILKFFSSEKIKNQTPISACSAYVQETEKIKAKKSGMKYYITKPIVQQNLETVIESCIFQQTSKN